jgi:beta-glucosidase
MRSLVGDRLPFFTKSEQEKLASSYDFMGLNYYTARFARHIDISPDFKPALNTDDAYSNPECEKIFLRSNPSSFIVPLTNFIYPY